MGDLWRSQPMQLVQLFINLEAAHDTVDELGELGLVQFRDVRAKFWFVSKKIQMPVVFPNCRLER